MTSSHPDQEIGLAGLDVVLGAPRRWLGLEAMVLLLGILVAYASLGQSWWLVPATILVPDLAATGYLAGSRVGAHLYNVAHTTPLPVVMPSPSGPM